MAVLEITTVGNPVLRQRAQPVEKITKKTRRLMKDMADTLYSTSNGIGLAAPQVGVAERVIVVDIGEGLITVINPRISAASGSDVDIEGCLSIPGLCGYVERATHVRVEGLDEKGKPLRIDAEGLLARVFQHEIDHLDGILFTDKATGLHRVDVATERSHEKANDADSRGQAREKPTGEEQWARQEELTSRAVSSNRPARRARVRRGPRREQGGGGEGEA